jgi:hypothetical protein
MFFVFLLFTELAVIREHNSLIVDTISCDLDYFSIKFVEKRFVARDVTSDIQGMYGVGGREKANRLLDKALSNLKISSDKPKWFREFVSIFSVEATYEELADTLMKAYKPGTTAQLSRATSNQPNERPLGIGDLFEVKKEVLNVAPNWRGVGLALRLHPDVLNRIEADCRGYGVERCLEKTLSQWLQKAYDTARYGQPSWQLLVAAVADPAGGNNRALAEQIAANHNI